MKITHRYILTIATSVLISLWGCSDADNTGNSDNPLKDANVHFCIDLSVPSGEKKSSRSQTTAGGSSTDGSEQGISSENAIRDLMVALVSADGGKSICITSVKPSAEISSDISVFVSVPLESLSDFIGKSDIKIYVLANYGTTVNTSAFSPETATYSITDTDDALLSLRSGLPMANLESRTVSIPVKNELINHLTADNPLDLTKSDPLKLERSVARIDYIDGSKDKNHTFPITIVDGTTQTPTGYELTMSSMELFNIGKAAYIFRHTSANGDIADIKLFGDENATSYVMDCDATLKHGNGNDLPRDYFTSRTITADGIDSCPKSPVSGYSIWCYIPENTIPAADKQLQGYTTGLHFRLKITKAPEGVNIAGTSPLAISVMGESTTIDYDTDGYYLDYYYFIKHNDDDDLKSMGPMEFGIVRNNIYRMKIESINGLPEPYNPENPDENPKSALKLNVRVAKWYYEKFIFDM